MARVIFYGKPTCGGNARQRARLRASGHQVEERDLFGHPWSGDELRAFLGDLAPAGWFNRSAVRVKSREVDPEALAPEAALALLLADPRLIRRPLLDIGGHRLAGWDEGRLDALIGLKAGAAPVGEACVHSPGTGGGDAA
ncbi:ArsC/Spx/MgsR family protein [Aquabacter cavernae]|uniref:ArsC/Spx/MgsR family protein n=1 Tax=Aquabacter cavernae TaxID=2496029 RepID=UPI000F8C419B|nr:ArsC/Spx/MgsR family protein [Aquabacter cavernae]